MLGKYSTSTQLSVNFAFSSYEVWLVGGDQRLEEAGAWSQRGEALSENPMCMFCISTYCRLVAQLYSEGVVPCYCRQRTIS